MVNCLISSTSLPIKGDVSTVEEEQERQEKYKSYTCKSRGGLHKSLNLNWNIYLFSIKELYLIYCYVFCIGLGLLVGVPTTQVWLRCNAYVRTPRIVGSTLRLYN